MKSIRNTIIDPFRYQADRKLERKLVAFYQADIKRIEKLAQDGAVDEAKELAKWPEIIRGFGPVKEARAHEALQHRALLINRQP
jgi:indolepyruvate ferredoxin oxidoreductase